jgi:hypothetical protein
LEPVVIPCTFNKATTTVDKTWRISFDCQEGITHEVNRLVQKSEEMLYIVVLTESEYNAQRKNA